MRRDQKNWKQIIAIIDTPVPIIRAFFIPDQIQCDITFTSGFGVENTIALRTMFNMQPEAGKFAILIKILFNENGLRFRNYTVVLLAVFYLQQINKLPSMKAMQRGVRRIEIDGKFLVYSITRSLIHSCRLSGAIQ